MLKEIIIQLIKSKMFNHDISIDEEDDKKTYKTNDNQAFMFQKTAIKHKKVNDRKEIKKFLQKKHCYTHNENIDENMIETLSIHSSNFSTREFNDTEWINDLSFENDFQSHSRSSSISIECLLKELSPLTYKEQDRLINPNNSFLSFHTFTS